jgi:hypothetical protein
VVANAAAGSNNCTKYHGGKFEIVMVVSVNAAVFRDMTQCSLLGFCRRFEERVFFVFMIEAE